MAPPKPHIVLIHGAWHSPPYFAKVTALLQDHFYVVHSEQLPSVGTPPSWTPPADLTQDVSAARELFDAAIGANGNDVIVICHSWGGIVTGSALVGYTKKEREGKGLKGGVIKCGYMCAFMLDEGASLQDGGGEPPQWYDVNPPYITTNDPMTFYGDLSKDQRIYWYSQVQTHSFATLQAPATGAGWKTVPVSYLLCEKDCAIPAKFQEAMINAAKEKGASIEVERVESDHSPFLSRPLETAEWIRRVAGESL